MHPLGAHLRAAGHTVLIPDLPYHGMSHTSTPATPSLAAHALASATATVLSTLGLPAAAHIAAYSLGGRLALEIAPSPVLRALSLTLISSGLPPHTTSAKAAARARAHASSEALLASAAEIGGLRRWLSETWYAASLWGNLREAPGFEALLDARVDALELVSSDGPSKRVSAAAAASVALGAAEMTEVLAVPQGLRVLYLYGGVDAKYARVAEEVGELLSGALVQCVPACGHNVLFQAPEVVCGMVWRFVSPVAEGRCKPFVMNSMRIEEYSLPLVKSMRVGGKDVGCRYGALVVLSGVGGACGVGDIAPLPGLHEESLEEAVAKIRAWYAAVMDGNGRRSVRSGLLAGQFGDAFLKECRGEGIQVGQSGSIEPGSLSSLPPSASSAVCAALMQCVAHVNEFELGDFLGTVWDVFRGSYDSVVYNRVAPRPAVGVDIHASCSDWIETRKDGGQDRGKVFKLKVGFSDVQSDALAVKTLATSLREYNDILRLDANCSWTVAQFLSFCDLVQDVLDVIEFVEEPVMLKNLPELNELCQILQKRSSVSSPVRIGLDESLSRFSVDVAIAMLAAPGVAAAVLKPSVHGHIARIFLISRAARKHGVPIVISSAFDSGVGLAWACIVASSIADSPTVAHGIGTFHALHGDVIVPSFRESCVSERESSVSVLKCTELLRRKSLACLN